MLRETINGALVGNLVLRFHGKGLTSRLCLPVCPCKAPNSNKMDGTMLDLAEYIALDVLQTIWIINDG